MFEKRSLILLLTAALMVSAPTLAAAQQRPTSTSPLSQSEGGGEEKEGVVAEVAKEVKEEVKEEAEDSDSKIQNQSAQEALAAGRPIVAASKPWTLSVGLGTRVSQGTFANLSNEDPSLDAPIGTNSTNAFNRSSASLSISPSYVLGNFVGTASIGVTQWLSQGGGTNFPYERRISDLSLDVFWFGHTFEKTRTNLSVDLGASLPTSPFSRAANVIVDPFIVGILRQPLIGRMFFVASVAGGKTFHSFTSPTADINNIGEASIIYRNSGAEDLGDGRVAIEGRNTEYQIASGFGFNFIIGKKLTASTRYQYSRFWTYKAGIPSDCDTDPLCNQNALGGRGVGDSSGASLGLNYQLSKNFFARAGISSGQTPKTADNASFRFPFWNFEGAGNNNSSFNAGLSFVY